MQNVRAGFILFTYKLINVLDKKVGDILFILSAVFASGVLLLNVIIFIKDEPSLNFYNFKIEKEDIPISIAKWPALIITTLIISKLIKRYWIRNSGAPMKPPRDNCAIASVPGSLPLLTINFKYTLTTADNGFVFRWASADDITNINEIAKVAFKRTIFGKKIEDLITRNESHIKKKNTVIQIIEYGGNTKKIIGYTHVFAINQQTWQRFRAGKLLGGAITHNLIVDCESGFKDDEPFAILILSLVLPKEKWPEANVSNLEFQSYSGKVVIDALATHLKLYCTNEFKNTKIIPVVFETAYHHVSSFIKKYKWNSKEFTQDNVEVVCFSLLNPHAQAVK